MVDFHSIQIVVNIAIYYVINLSIVIFRSLREGENQKTHIHHPASGVIWTLNTALTKCRHTHLHITTKVEVSKFQLTFLLPLLGSEI